MKVYVVRQVRYPIKSFDGVECERAAVTTTGALLGDREWRFARLTDGTAVNGKTEPKVITLRAAFEHGDEGLRVSFSTERPHGSWNLPGQAPSLSLWLGDQLGYPVRLERNAAGGFPDDLEACGPTIISSPTIDAIAEWFALSAEEVRRRLRANIEINGDGMEPFWEDRLYGEEGCPLTFRIGAVTILGTNPCRRCGVPQRDSRTAEETVGFQKLFFERRKATLPLWAEPSWFTNAYRAAVNTNIPEHQWGRLINVGDELNI